MVEEDEGADHAALRRGQHAGDLERAEVVRAAVEDELDHPSKLAPRASLEARASRKRAAHGLRARCRRTIAPVKTHPTPAEVPPMTRRRTHDLGAFQVGRVLPAAKRRMVGPFIFFDHIGPVDLA
ncbi:MAG TPA: hypothetical protein VNE71_10545, partial [Myxococcota bacterium]|nr:hypothetical protein [Myxococcota bacterium]